jgi:hypothetical protein
VAVVAAICTAIERARLDCEVAPADVAGVVLAVAVRPEATARMPVFVP